jgi:hypothetical protein
MTSIGPDTRYTAKAKMINDAVDNTLRPAVGIIISKAIQDEIRTTKGWLRLPAFVDPTFHAGQFEVVTSEVTWELKTANLKEADLRPYTAFEIGLTRFAIAIFVGCTLALSILGYFVFVR